MLDELEKLDNWFMFGTRLGVPVNQLRKIESSHQLSIDRCKVDMLQYCLDNHVDISWVKIAETLEKTDQLALAAKIRQKYLSTDGKGKSEMKNDVYNIKIIIIIMKFACYGLVNHWYACIIIIIWFN